MDRKVARMIDILVEDLQYHPVVFLPDIILAKEFDLSEADVHRLAKKFAKEFSLQADFIEQKIRYSELKELFQDPVIEQAA